MFATLTLKLKSLIIFEFNLLTKCIHLIIVNEHRFKDCI